MRKSLNAAVVDDALLDPDLPVATRQQALEVYFANQAERAVALEIELGYPLTRAMQANRIQRAAQRLHSQWTGYDVTLGQSGLRERMSGPHGRSDDDTLKRQMLLTALEQEPFLMKWLKKRARTPTVSNVLEIVNELSRRSPTASCKSGQL